MKKINRRSPDFFVIGAQKAGTTTLHDRLARCALVNLPVMKETQYFSDDDKYRRGLDWYYRQFSSSDSFERRGEVAPDYLFSELAPIRIKLLNPSPNLICIFRNPIERAYSHYLMAVRNGYETLSFQEALLAEPERLSVNDPKSSALYSYIGRSLYGKQLANYFDALPGASYLFLKFEDVIDDGSTGSATYQNICDFISVSKCANGATNQSIANVASRPKSTIVRNFLYRPSVIKKAIRVFIPSYDLRAKIAYRLDKINQRPIIKEPIPHVSSKIAGRIIDDLSILQKITKLDLTHWVDEIAGLCRGE